MTVLWALSAAWAGGWTRDLGDAYLKAETGVYTSSRVRVPGEEEDSGGRYTGVQVSGYGEVGLLRAHPVQLSASAPLVVGSHRTEIFDAFGAVPVRATTVRMGDLRVATQVALHPRHPLAVAVEAKVPLYANGTVGQSLPTHADLFPKPGDGQLDLTLWGYGAGAVGDGFVEGGVGYLHRTEQFVGWEPELALADGGRALGKVGYKIGPCWALGSVEAQWAWRGTIDGDLDTFTRQFVAATLAGLWELGPHWGLEPRVGAELWSRNASQGVSAGLGVSWRAR